MMVFDSVPIVKCPTGQKCGPYDCGTSVWMKNKNAGQQGQNIDVVDKHNAKAKAARCRVCQSP